MTSDFYPARSLDLASIETAEPESVDRLLNQISNAIAHCHAEMERIDPSFAAGLPTDKGPSLAPTIISDLLAFLREINLLGDRIDRTATKLGRAV